MYASILMLFPNTSMANCVVRAQIKEHKNK